MGANFGPAFHEQRLLYLTVSYIHCVQYLENLRKIFGKNVTSASCFNMVVIDECKLLFCHIRSYFYLISLPWKYASRGITWSRLSFRHCQTSYISFFHTRLKLEWVQVYNALSFVDWSEIFFSANTKERNGKHADFWLYSLTVPEVMLFSFTNRGV